MKIKVKFLGKDFEFGFWKGLYYYFIQIPLSMKKYYLLVFISRDHETKKDIEYFIYRIYETKKLRREIRNKIINPVERLLNK